MMSPWSFLILLFASLGLSLPSSAYVVPPPGRLARSLRRALLRRALLPGRPRSASVRRWRPAPRPATSEDEDESDEPDEPDEPSFFASPVGVAVRDVLSENLIPLAGPIERGVPGDTVAGAALAVSTATLLTGLGPSSAAACGLGAAYVSLHPTPGGRALRAAGSLTVRSLSAATAAYAEFEGNRKLSAATRRLMAAGARSLEREGRDAGFLRKILEEDEEEEERLRGEVEAALAAAQAEIDRIDRAREEAARKEEEAAEETARRAAEEAAKRAAEEAAEEIARAEAEEAAAEEEEGRREAQQRAEEAARRAAEEIAKAAQKAEAERVKELETRRAAEEIAKAAQKAEEIAAAAQKAEAERLAELETAQAAAVEAFRRAEREEEEALRLVQELEEEEEALSATEAVQKYEEEMRAIATERVKKANAKPKKKAVQVEIVMESEEAAPSVEYTSMTVVELKQVLRSKGLKVSGRKGELVQRLLSS